MANWIIAHKPQIYRTIKAFIALGMVDQQTTNDIKNDDTVFIYQSAPSSRIILAARVIDAKVSEEKLIDDKNYFLSEEKREKFNKAKINVHYIRLKPVKYFDEYINEQLTFKKLQENGCTETLFRQINLDKDFPQLLNYIKSVTLE